MVCCVLFGACSKKPQGKVYQFHGTVVRVDPENGVAAIHNEKIAGWMDAMTMEYSFASKAELNSLHAGERIGAKLTVSEESYSLSEIREEQEK